MAVYNAHETEKDTIRISHHGRKPKTELTIIIEHGTSFLSDCSELSILAPNKPNIPTYVERDAEGEITNHIVMACTKTEER